MLLPPIFILVAIAASNAQQMAFWLTDPDAKIFFQQHPSSSPNKDNDVEMLSFISMTVQDIKP